MKDALIVAQFPLRNVHINVYVTILINLVEQIEKFGEKIKLIKFEKFKSKIDIIFKSFDNQNDFFDKDSAIMKVLNKDFFKVEEDLD